MSVTPYWTSRDGRHVLYHGECLAVLPTLAPHEAKDEVRELFGERT